MHDIAVYWYHHNAANIVDIAVRVAVDINLLGLEHVLKACDLL